MAVQHNRFSGSLLDLRYKNKNKFQPSSKTAQLATADTFLPNSTFYLWVSLLSIVTKHQNTYPMLVRFRLDHLCTAHLYLFGSKTGQPRPDEFVLVKRATFSSLTESFLQKKYFCKKKIGGARTEKNDVRHVIKVFINLVERSLMRNPSLGIVVINQRDGIY